MHGKPVLLDQAYHLLERRLREEMLSERTARRRLAAILAADAAGYSGLMATDEAATVAAIEDARVAFRKHVEANKGRIVDTPGDFVLAIFELATSAVLAALAIQRDLTEAGREIPEQRRMRFRIGLHIGEVIEKSDGSVYGDGVNIAARLQALAEPAGIATSDSVRTAVQGRLATVFDDLGEQTVKNIPQLLRVYHMRVNTDARTDGTTTTQTAVSMSSPVPGFGGRPAVAVLPFVNMSAEPDQEYFADGLAEDILTRLAMWRWLPVIARNSSFAYKKRNVDIKQIGRALGVRYVLEGSVRRAGDRVRVTGQLIDADTGHHIWAERYDRKTQDLFAVQDELTDGIANALQAVIGLSELERVRHRQPENLDAWNAFQRGWWHALRFTQEEFALAEPLLRKAIELDPGMSQPFTAIALLRFFSAFFLWSAPRAAFAEAAKYSQQALAVDPRDSQASSILGLVLAYTGRQAEALAFMKKGVELNPSSFIGFAVLTVGHLLRGEFVEGIRAGERAIRISPDDTVLHVVLAALSANHYMEREFERAVEIARLAVQRAPHYPFGWRSLANALGQIGPIEEATQALAEFLKLVPSYTSEGAARASAGMREGDPREASFAFYLEGLRKAGWQG
jgi:adenylate cyclase